MTVHPIDATQFYLTTPAPCPYLEGMWERKVFTHLVGDKAVALNDALSQGGFRRSQSIAYRPACEFCRSCVSVRVLTGEFTPTRSMQRVLRKNRLLVASEGPAEPTVEQFSLFRRYLESRHSDGGMAKMTMMDYMMMVEDSHVNSMIIEYRVRGPDTYLTGAGDGELLAVALTDRLSNGLSMVYSFFDPELSPQSPGTFMVLDHIERARKLGLPYLYLGYWVAGSPKMEYKQRFVPQERLTPTGWRKHSKP